MSAFRIVAEGGACMADRQEIRRALSILLGGRHELRRLPGGACRPADLADLDAATDAAVGFADGHVYYSLNPIKAGADRATKGTVTDRRWLLVDCDPVRDVALSSTDEEKACSLALACEVVDRMASLGWPAPLVVDSGNGYHVLYRVDLPNGAMATQWIKAVLERLAGELNTARAEVDTAVHDAPRIAKLPGSWARKGPNTPDRPHRPCRIYYEPESLDVVPAELIRDFANPPKDKKGDKSSFKATATENTKDGYVRTAVERECLRVSLAPSGERNVTLNDAAFRLGTLAGWPEAAGLDIPGQLLHAAKRAGLPEGESLTTIRSGWEAGKLKPRERPADQADAKGKPAADPDEPLTIRGNHVVPENVKWIWQDVIAFNFMNLFAGRTGIGKSFILCDVAARLSKGLPMPDGSGGGTPQNTLFISEDPYQYVLVPRLIEMGADLERIGFMRWKAMAQFTLADTDMLERAWLECDRPANIIIDPPANFLGGKDEHKNAETRSVLMRISDWLESRPVAVSLVTHFNKAGGKGLDAIYRMMGSVAWGSTARIACGCEVDPNDPNQCLFGGVKSNISGKARTLAYRIEPTDTLARLVWLGNVDTSVDDAINKVKKKSAGMCAVEWLVERFRESREWESGELKRQALAYGLTFNQVFKSPEVNALPIVKRPYTDVNGERKYRWVAIPPWPPEKKSETSETSESWKPSPSQQTTSELSDVSAVDPKAGRGPKPSMGPLSDSERAFGDKEKPSESSQVVITPWDSFQVSEVSEVSEVEVIRSEINEAFVPDGQSRAIRWLATVLQAEPVPREAIHRLGNALLFDSEILDAVASRIGVERTYEQGVEHWSLA